jgi:predicted dehydrogenase
MEFDEPADERRQVASVLDRHDVADLTGDEAPLLASARMVRLGLIAASRIAKPAVVDPVADVDGVELTAIAARDPERARSTASQWGISAVFDSYEALIASPDVDAVYIGTPASLHRQPAIAAIEAGKHVLCEKPFAANADDARLIADAARGSDVVVMEAFHWRYHPYAQQIRDVLDSGVLGKVERVEAVFDIPDGHIARDDIRWSLPLGGGATMDLGCYSIQWARFAAGPDPEVVSAEAVCLVDGIDGSLVAELCWPSGVTGRVGSSMIAPGADEVIYLRVVGEQGEMVATNPLAPQKGGALLTVDAGGTKNTYDVARTATYFHQLEAFRDAIVDGKPFPTTADDGVRNMEIIDACYRAAGLDPRPTA